jgi:ribonuclease D
MTYTLYKDDIPDNLFKGVTSIAIDTEAMGLNIHRDRLCLVQLSSGDGHAYLVQTTDYAKAVNLKKLLVDERIEKLFHFARFDVAILEHYLGVQINPIFCTKIASKLVRTYTERHGLKELCRTLLGVEISKQEQSTDWGADVLSDAQLTYAASDVLYLHRLKQKLVDMLEREGRLDFAKAFCAFLPTRARLDIAFGEEDIFHH